MEMKNISKHFSGVKALDKIQFDLRKGEIHSLLGENGAGKSTMIKILAGIHTPTEGQIFINGKEVKIEKVSDAKELGISVIHQELSLVPYMTVAENIYLGRMPSKKSGFVDDRKLEADAYKVLERLGVQDVIHVNDYPANLTGIRAYCNCSCSCRWNQYEWWCWKNRSHFYRRTDHGSFKQWTEFHERAVLLAVCVSGRCSSRGSIR